MNTPLTWDIRMNSLLTWETGAYRSKRTNKQLWERKMAFVATVCEPLLNIQAYIFFDTTFNTREYEKQLKYYGGLFKRHFPDVKQPYDELRRYIAVVKHNEWVYSRIALNVITNLPDLNYII